VNEHAEHSGAFIVGQGKQPRCLFDGGGKPAHLGEFAADAIDDFDRRARGVERAN
jgi:hypothetical protein